MRVISLFARMLHNSLYATLCLSLSPLVILTIRHNQVALILPLGFFTQTRRYRAKVIPTLKPIKRNKAANYYPSFPTKTFVGSIRQLKLFLITVNVATDCQHPFSFATARNC